MGDIEKFDVTPTGLKELSGKQYRFVKFAGGKDAMAWGPVDLAAALGQPCVAEVKPDDDPARSPTLISLTVKATGEVVYRAEQRGKGGGGGAGYGGRVSDPAERASIEAQSALSHSLQEIRMAGDFLLRLHATAAPFDEAAGQLEGSLKWFEDHLEALADRIASWTKAHHEPLAGELARIRAGNVGGSASGPASGPSGSAADGSKGRASAKAKGDDAPAPAAKDPPSQPAGVPSAGPEPNPVGRAALQAAVLKRFGTIAGVKAASLEVFGEALTPSKLDLQQLEALAIDPSVEPSK